MWLNSSAISILTVADNKKFYRVLYSIALHRHFASCFDYDGIASTNCFLALCLYQHLWICLGWRLFTLNQSMILMLLYLHWGCVITLFISLNWLSLLSELKGHISWFHWLWLSTSLTRRRNALLTFLVLELNCAFWSRFIARIYYDLWCILST